jgi:hypothetical protein
MKDHDHDHDHDDECHSPECDQHFKELVATLIARLQSSDTEGVADVIVNKQGQGEIFITRLDMVEASRAAADILNAALYQGEEADDQSTH